MQKTWVWSTTGFTLVGKSHEEIQQLCRGAGLAGIEASVELFPTTSEAELEAIGASYREAGLKFDSFHLPFEADDDIASFYESTRRQAVDKARYWMERAALLGARVGIQHPTTNRLNADVEGLDNYFRQLDKSLQVLLPAAEQLGFVIALENLPPGEAGGRLSARPEHFARFTAEFAHPNLGFCLDTGHALIAAGPEKAALFLEIMAPHLQAFHLSDTAGDRDSHLAPGRGLVEWDGVFRQAAASAYSHSMCIETPPFAHGPDYSLEAWQQMVQETGRLAENALAN